MPPPPRNFRWSPPSTPGKHSDPVSTRTLDQRIQALSADRVSPSADLVRTGCREILEWLDARSPEPRRAFDELERGMTDLARAHAWRAGVARWLGAVRLLLERAEAGAYGTVPIRDLLAEELGLWLGGADAGMDEDWDGEPLSRGRRLPDLAEVARAAAGEVDRGETIAVQGGTEAVTRALESAVDQGLEVEVVLSEGGPELAGRGIATRLVARGSRPRVVYDAALIGEIASVDRVWIGTESVGAQALVAPIGTRVLCEEARRREVPVQVLTTTDVVAPAGEYALPGWGEHETWRLWERAPSGVRLQPQPYEPVSLELVDVFVTERGRMTAAELSLAALRTDVPTLA